MFGKRKLPESLYRQQPNAGYRPDQPYTVDGFEFLPMAQKQAKLAEIHNGAQQFASENFSRGMAQDYPAQADYMPQGYTGGSGDGAIERQMGERNIPVSGSMGGPMIDPRMVEQPKPRKRGLFGSGAGIADILGIIGDGFGDRGPIYAQGKMHQAELDAQRQQIAAAQRQKLEDRAYEASEWTRRQQFEIDNPKPVNNDTVNDLNWYKNLTDADRKLYHQMKPTVGYRADGTPFVVNPYDLQPQSGPQVGQIEDGHRFKGGNPADPASWEKVGGAGSNTSGGF